MFEKGSTILYEIFNNLLSGIPVIIALYYSSGDIITTLAALSKVNYVVLIGSAYLIGTVIHSISFIIQHFSINKIYKIDNKSEKHIVLRKDDQDNWHYIEKWYTMSNSHLSLSVSLSLSLVILSYSKISIPIIIIVLIIISIILLIIQAFKYGSWAKRDIENAILKIKKHGG